MGRRGNVWMNTNTVVKAYPNLVKSSADFCFRDSAYPTLIFSLARAASNVPPQDRREAAAAAEAHNSVNVKAMAFLHSMPSEPWEGNCPTARHRRMLNVDAEEKLITSTLDAPLN